MRRSPSLLAVVVAAAACGHGLRPGAASAGDEGTWQAWLVLGPVVEAARHHTSAPIAAGLAEASKLLAKGKVRAADARLARLASAGGDPWVLVARADLVAFYFTTCIKGVAFRLEDTRPGTAPPVGARQRIDGEDARVRPGDVSVEALLSGVERTVASGIDELAVQGKMARARLTAYASACPANEQVRARAQAVMRADLAELAAAGRLAPDLAFMWAGLQMNEYSAAAARPFLHEAHRGGFDDPSLPLLLAIAERDAGDPKAARAWAEKARARFAAAGDRAMEAEAEFLLGTIAQGWGRPSAAAVHFRRALELDPYHVQAVLSQATLVLRTDGEAEAVAYLARVVADRFAPVAWDEPTRRAVVDFGEGLVLAAGDEPALVQALRDAFLLDVDAAEDPASRGARYFFASTLDARLAEYERARGHALLARQELAESDVDLDLSVDEVIESLPAGDGP